ncbi:hypothetical protein V2I01_43300 [Micromonospora sp. BRA006-A]|nr:hypothetical protein [Micromonospora sp. BRA006-A]
MPNPDTGTLRGDALRCSGWRTRRGRPAAGPSSACSPPPRPTIPELLTLMRERSGADTMDRAWIGMLERAAARGEAPAAAVRHRVATVPMMLLRAEYAMRGVPPSPTRCWSRSWTTCSCPLVRGHG